MQADDNNPIIRKVSWAVGNLTGGRDQTSMEPTLRWRIGLNDPSLERGSLMQIQGIGAAPFVEIPARGSPSWTLACYRNSAQVQLF
jgi:hypothetical protein